MTDEQLSLLLDKLDLLLRYIDAINQVTVKQLHYLLFLSIVAALAAGLYIGYRWGHK